MSASLICAIIFFVISLLDFIEATGVLISCATPATSWPKEAIFSELISLSWVSFNSSSVLVKSLTIFSFFL